MYINSITSLFTSVFDKTIGSTNCRNGIIYQKQDLSHHRRNLPCIKPKDANTFENDGIQHPESFLERGAVQQLVIDEKCPLWCGQ